jgi:predicted Zn-ribbon and HTH transcriptional regulator
MKLEININEKEFGIDIADHFQDFFKRLQAEIKSRLVSNDTLICGNYELEIIEMFLTAFKNATIEQQPTVTSTNNSGEMTYPQVEGITPTVALPDVDKEVDRYRKMLKHPVIKSIMGMDETQEQLDFIQPHKRIPVTLTVSGDLISRQAAVDAIQHAFDRETLLNSFVRKVAVDALKTMTSVKPQERTGHWIVKKDCEGKTRKCICDKCGYETGKYTWKNPNYCADCGARMIEERSEE